MGLKVQQNKQLKSTDLQTSVLSKSVALPEVSAVGPCGCWVRVGVTACLPACLAAVLGFLCDSDVLLSRRELKTRGSFTHCTSQTKGRRALSHEECFHLENNCTFFSFTTTFHLIPEATL